MLKKDKNVAEVLVECLEAHGVSYIFGVPGEENLVFLEAVRNSKITFITTRHEQAAAFMAATIGRITGKIGVALSTLGPGATNLMTGVAYAQLGGFPIMVITGQKPIKKSRQGKFQIVDVVGIMKPVTKFSTTVTDGKTIVDIFSEAVSLAETERAGAVHIELPEDIAEEACEAKPVVLNKIIYHAAEEKSILQALEIIEKSNHPLVVLGRGTNKESISDELKKFFGKTRIPFVSTQMGKGAVDETSELCIGATALSNNEYVHKALNHADVLIFIGHDVIEKPPIVLNTESTKNCKIVHINFFPSNFKDIYTPTHQVIGDITSTISAITKKIKNNPNWDFSYFFEIREIIRKDIVKFSKSTDFPLRPERIIADIQKILPSDGMLTLDNGMYKLWTARNFLTRETNGLLLDNTLATMGAGLPSGIALKMLYPKKKVLVVVGDGGIMMSIGDLETAVRLKLNLAILVLDDSGYGMISWKQKDMKLASFAMSFNNPDFIALAKSFGAVGHKVEKVEELEKLLKETLDSKGVHIIACPINYVEANKTLIKL